jgi:polar amino acid transport system ATP-binding protein
MDEGLIYEEGTPEEIFGDPKKEKTRAFVNRIRTWSFRIASPDFDRYAMNAEIEAFCEKHIVPRETRYNLMLAIEEILEMVKPGLRDAPLDLALTWSGKTDALEVTFERGGEWPNPLESDQPDDFGVRIVRRVAEAVDYRLGDGRSRLVVRIGKT